ncbi:MAG: acylphosphatase [Patescibacteria group bacterium]
MKEIYCKIYGNVQGVFFREYAKKRAGELGVTGYVKNLDDGTVELVAQGEDADLRTYLGYVSVGPEDGEVESINVQWGPLDVRESGFSLL